MCEKWENITKAVAVDFKILRFLGNLQKPRKTENEQFYNMFRLGYIVTCFS